MVNEIVIMEKNQKRHLMDKEFTIVN